MGPPLGKYFTLLWGPDPTIKYNRKSHQMLLCAAVAARFLRALGWVAPTASALRCGLALRRALLLPAAPPWCVAVLR